MKKIFSTILLIAFAFNFLVTPAFAKDIEYLCAVKNAKSADVRNVAEFYSRQRNMPIVKTGKDYTFVKISSLPNDFYYMSYEQVAKDVYFYYYSPSENIKIKADLLKRFKLNNLSYSRLSSKPAMVIKKQNADKIIAENLKQEQPTKSSKTTTVYDFSDEAQQRYDAIQNSVVKTLPQNPQVKQENKKVMNQTIKLNQSQPTQPKPVTSNSRPMTFTPNPMVSNQRPMTGNVWSPQNNSAVATPTQFAAVNTSVLPVGLSFAVIMQSDISTGSLEQNDRISAILQNDLYVNNKLIAEKGSIVYGTATQASKAGRAYGDASAALTFDKILTTQGEELSFKSERLVYKNSNSHRGAKIAGTMFAAVFAGVAAAALGGAIRDTDDWGQTLGIGAAVGAVGGTVTLLTSTGEEIELKQGTVLTIKTIR